MIGRSNFQSTIDELKITLKFAFPIVLSQLGQLAFGIMDAVMVGRIGAVPLSASAFVLNVSNIPMVFALGMSISVSVLISQSFGEKNYRNCGKILNNGLFFVGGITFVIVLLLIAFSSHLALFKQPDEVLNAGIAFFKLTSWSILPFVLFFILKNFTEGVSKPSIPLIFLACGLVINFFLAWIMIYGNLGFTALGLKGAGIATLISRWLVVISLYVYLVRAKAFKKYEMSFSKKDINFVTLLNVARIGIPSGFQFLFEVAAFAGSGIMIGWLGAKTLAAHQISLQIASTTFMVALGLAFAVAVRVGQSKGEQDYVQLRRIGIGAFGFIAVVLGLSGLLIFIFRNFLPTLFISDPEVDAMAAQILIIVCLFQISDSTQAVAMSALRGLQDVRAPTLIAFFAYWVVALPLGYYLAFVVGLKHIGIWAALGISLFCSSLLLVMRFLYKSKKLIKENEITYG